jgi:hypothetical protein
LKNFIVRELVGPIASRIGTAAAGALVGYLAIAPDSANVIGAGLTAALLVGLDLLTGKLLRQ